MYSVYAVVMDGGSKHRHYLKSFESIEEAKHLANCATCGNSAYAYIKDSAGGTVFFLRPPSYDPQPIDPLTSRQLGDS